MKNYAIFFDISKAFDKIWHNGILFKLKNYKFENFIILWILNLLENRTFKIKVNSSFSEIFQIEVGVPQGGVLSPILFSLYINDIIFEETKYRKTRTESTLFADDLTTYCTTNNPKTAEKVFQIYLRKLENWLHAWRLTINPKKCQFIVFTKGLQTQNVEFKLFNETIPETDQIKFLGIIFDNKMTFKRCVDEIKAKCKNRLNIIKILAQKSWTLLKEETLKDVYVSLTRSIIDYAAIIFDILSETNKKELRSIQYHALRASYRKPLKFSHTELLEISTVKTIDERCTELNHNYFKKAFLFNNELTSETIKNYLNIYPDSRTPKTKTILCYYRNTLKQFFLSFDSPKD